jgi:hypothetical protein
MEVLVATVIFALASTVLAGLFVKTLSLSENNTQRTTAANLATQQMEKLRQTRALDIPDGLTVIGPITVGGTKYTIKQSAHFTTQNGTACNSATGGDIVSKQVTLEVTWPDMGSTRPVRSDTIRTLGKGTDDLGTSTGAAAVAVQSSTGAGTGGIVVTLKTAPAGTVVASQTAGSDGCVVFAGLTPGNYTAAANTVGYVNQDGAQAATTSTFSVPAAAVGKAVLPYDLLGGLVVSPKPSNNNYVPPTNLGMTLSTSIWSPSQNRAYVSCIGTNVTGCVSGATDRLASSLFPASYGAWAGTCLDAVPTGTIGLVPVTAGNTATYNATNLGLVNANITTALLGAHLYAVHAADAKCTAGETYDLGVVTTGQTVKVALPLGTWNLRLSASGSAPLQNVALTSTTAAQTVSVLL